MNQKTNISSFHAEKLYERYFINDTDNHIISVIGQFGSGKSTINQLLVDKVITSKSKNLIVAQYDALQFAESSQVTSALYSSIANARKINWCNRNNIRAIAQLKKEGVQNNLATGQIWGILILGIGLYLLKKISSLHEINAFLGSIPKRYSVISVFDPSMCNKVGLLFIVFIFICWKRNWLVQLVAGFLPTKSHADILRQINCKGEQLVLIVDEIDRLSPESVKSLLDEIYIMSSLWRKSDRKFKIFLFYDEHEILASYIQLKISNPHIYLQKFYDSCYRISHISLISDLVMVLNRLEASVDQEIIKYVSEHLSSFRKLQHFIQLIEHHMSGAWKARTGFLVYDSGFFFSLSIYFLFRISTLKNVEDSVAIVKYFKGGLDIFTKISNYSVEKIKDIIEKQLRVISLELTDEGFFTSLSDSNKMFDLYMSVITNQSQLKVMSWMLYYIGWDHHADYKKLTSIVPVEKFHEILRSVAYQLMCNQLESSGFANYSFKILQKHYLHNTSCMTWFIRAYLYLEQGDISGVNKNFLLGFKTKDDKIYLNTILICSFYHFGDHWFPDMNKKINVNGQYNIRHNPQILGASVHIGEPEHDWQPSNQDCRQKLYKLTKDFEAILLECIPSIKDFFQYLPTFYSFEALCLMMHCDTKYQSEMIFWLKETPIEDILQATGIMFFIPSICLDKKLETIDKIGINEQVRIKISEKLIQFPNSRDLLREKMVYNTSGGYSTAITDQVFSFFGLEEIDINRNGS